MKTLINNIYIGIIVVGRICPEKWRPLWWQLPPYLQSTQSYCGAFSWIWLGIWLSIFGLSVFWLSLLWLSLRYGNPYYGTEERLINLSLQIQSIKIDYKKQIKDVRHNKSISHAQRRQEIRTLKAERDQAIINAQINYRYG